MRAFKSASTSNAAGNPLSSNSDGLQAADRRRGPKQVAAVAVDVDHPAVEGGEIRSTGSRPHCSK